MKLLDYGYIELVETCGSDACITEAERETIFRFNLANAAKYIWRAGLNSESPVDNLKKAAWYVNREIDRLTKGHE